MVLGGMDLVKMFLLFSPREWFEGVVVAGLKDKEGLHDISFGEMLRWLGKWLLLSTTIKMDRKKFWSNKPVERERAAPHFDSTI